MTSETIGKLQAEIGDRKTSRIENYWEYQRKCPDTYDAIKVFESTGIQIVTDLSFAKSCETITDAANVRSKPILLGSTATKPEKPKVALRSFLPENWLFELTFAKGKVLKGEMTSPHTITSWVGEAICMNNELGLGVSKPSTLVISQDFLAEIRLP